MRSATRIGLRRTRGVAAVVLLAAALIAALAPAAARSPLARAQQQDTDTERPDDVGPAAALELDRQQVVFGAVPLGDRASRSVTARSVGGADLVIEAIGVSTINGSTAFSVDPGACTQGPIPAGGSCTFTVSFEPTVEAQHHATVATISNAAASPHQAALVGIGVARPALEVEPQRLGFGDAEVGGERTAALTVTNVGTADLAVRTVALEGADPDAYDVAGDDCSGRTLTAQERCDVTVAFRPAAEGAATATLVVAANDPASPHPVPLEGTGRPAGEAQLTLSRTAIDFGAVRLDTQVTRAVTLGNAGDAPLTVGSVAVEGGAGAFGVVGDACSGRTLGPDDACEVRLGFRPGAEQPVQARAVVTSDAPGSPHTFTLVGTGAGADPVVVPDLGGLGLADAEDAVGTAGLTLVIVAGPDVDGATVADQDPVAGTEVEAGTAVAVRLEPPPFPLTDRLRDLLFPWAAAGALAAAVAAAGKHLRGRSRRWVRRHVRLVPRSGPLTPRTEEVDERPSRSLQLVPQRDRGSLTVEEILR